VTDLDGEQPLVLYWIDPVDAMDRFVARPEFKDKLYYQYERQRSEQIPTKRAFGRANSGLVFQEAQAFDMFSVPLLHLFYSDKSFSGKHGSHHPAYRECVHLLCNSCISGIICIETHNKHTYST